MATSQKTRPQQATEASVEQSLALVQNLLRAGVSEIAYLRNLFDDEVFTGSTLGSTKVKLLTPRDKATGATIDADALRLSTYIEAAMEAISKRYLRSFVRARARASASAHLLRPAVRGRCLRHARALSARARARAALPRARPPATLSLSRRC